MAGLALAAGFALAAGGGPGRAIAAPAVSTDTLRTGYSFFATKTYTQEEDLAIIERFRSLRITDVTDGMDAVGLQNIGLVDPDIHPLWKDTEHFTHRFVGAAVTARYVPTQRPPAGLMPTADFRKWVGRWYGTIAPEAFAPLLRPGTALVIDNAGGPYVDVGPIGSNNSMGWRARGIVGVVTNGTARDTDEIIKERIPVYFRQTGRGIRPGRIEMESVNRPVVIGGALVTPGDVIVADGDGVIVVPREQAEAVAAYAQEVAKGDKAARRGLYKKLGLPEDESVK
jgi:regulator of RNase E activity RraA